MAFLLGFSALATGSIWLFYVERGNWPALLQGEIARALAEDPVDTGWIRLQVHGRTVMLTGEAPDRAALANVRKRISAVPGVRKVIAHVRFRKWGKLVLPTVNGLATRVQQPAIKGTWPSNAAEGLSLELNGELYVLGESASVTVDGNDWTLVPKAPLADGRYDLDVTVWQGELSASDDSVDEIQIDTKPPEAPRVDRYFGRSQTPQLKGRWPMDDASRLRVELAGQTYELGRDPELAVQKAGVWTLKPRFALREGTHKVVATAYDAVGNARSNTKHAEVVIDLTPPAQPTVQRFQSSRVFTLRGTWAQGDAVTLQVSVAGRAYTLGQDPELMPLGSGQWRLTPSVLPGEGTYDVSVLTKDRAGNVSQDITTNELIIKFVPERAKGQALEELPRPVAPFMCQQGFKRVLQQGDVRFVGKSSQLAPQSLHVLDELVALAARCPSARLEIGVHTDSVGDFSQNRRLSQLQAFAVAAHFARRGIARSRLSSVGFGEARPIASNNSAAGRAKNRRIELYVKR